MYHTITVARLNFTPIWKPYHRKAISCQILPFYLYNTNTLIILFVCRRKNCQPRYMARLRRLSEKTIILYNTTNIVSFLFSQKNLSKCLVRKTSAYSDWLDWWKKRLKKIVLLPAKCHGKRQMVTFSATMMAGTTRRRRRKKVVLLLFLLDLINGDDAQLDGVISNCPLGFICYHHHLFSTHSQWSDHSRFMVGNWFWVVISVANYRFLQWRIV